MINNMEMVWLVMVVMMVLWYENIKTSIPDVDFGCGHDTFTDCESVNKVNRVLEKLTSNQFPCPCCSTASRSSISSSAHQSSVNKGNVPLS